jgi:TolA-binding protein
MRPIPLPVLTLNNYVSGGFLEDVIKEKTLSAASVNMLKLTQRNEKPPLELKWPRVFSMDLADPQTGEESSLYQILEDHFKQFEWESARDNLQGYLALPRTKDVQARARFYLGQTQYFTGNYKEALWEFLSFRSINPDEANSWIDAVLSAMVY